MEVGIELTRMHNKAKIALLNRKDCVFITTVLFSLRSIWDTGMPTAYTDGAVLGMNPKFFEALSHDQRQTLLAHEAYHVAFNHMVRGRNLDFKVYNQAADFAINLMLRDAGFAPISGWLCDDKYRGMSADKIYKLLILI